MDKPPMPTVRLEKPPLVSKLPVFQTNYADAGDAAVEKYNALESAVRLTEDVDAAVSNAGAAAGAAVRTAPSLASMIPASTSFVAKATPVLNSTRVVASKVAPIQAALWATDAGRALVDSAYRDKSLAATKNLLNDPSKSTASKSLDVGLNTLARPISSTGSLMRTYNEASDQIKASEQKSKEVDEELKKRRIEAFVKKGQRLSKMNLTNGKVD